MRTIRTKVYTFNELSENAKEKAIENYRNSVIDHGYLMDDLYNSVEKLREVFYLDSSQYRFVTPSSTWLETVDNNVTGVRLYKWIVNNFWHELYRNKYLAHRNRHFSTYALKCRNEHNYLGEEYSSVYSKLRFEKDCVLTGTCYDNEILEPIYNFLERPIEGYDAEDLIRDINSAVEQAVRREEEYLNSDEYISETLSENDYEFLIDGTIYS